MEGVILGSRVKEGTLLTAPDSVIEDILSPHRPKSIVGIVDLMQLITTWTSREELESSAKRWAQEKLTGDGLAKGRGAKRSAGEEGKASEASDAMEDVTLGGETVVIERTTVEPAKNPRHE
jgi:hypothetical protein